MRLPEDAEEMLKAIEDSSGGTNDAYDKLKAGYFRLWKLGALKGFDELRISLFHLVLCCFMPQSVDRLTCILQNQIGSLSVSETEILYSNFMVSDVGKNLRFTHNSAREFVMTEILGKTSGDPRESLASLVMKESHRSVAKLFVDFIQRSDSRDSSEVLEALDFSYFHIYGLKHCKCAAEKSSIFDKVWSDMIQRVLLPAESGLAANIVAFFVSEDARRYLFRNCEGKFYLLFSHILVWLKIIHDDDASDPRLEDLKTASSDTGTPEGMLRHFAERAAIKSTGTNATALHVACLMDSTAAVNLVLKSTYYLYGKDACTNLVFSPSEINGGTRTPFVLSLPRDETARTSVMETLLWFESRYLDTGSDKEKGNSSQPSHKAQQWSHMIDKYQSVLTHAVRKYEEETVCRLLKIAGPVAINEFNENGYTPVMAAISWGRLKIMRVLVEDCHADLNVKGLRGNTALDIARRRNQQAANYLEMRMNISEPGQSVDLSPKVKGDTS